jgi:hypothetical protein
LNSSDRQSTNDIETILRVLPKLEPMRLTRRPEPFDHPEWIFELKRDNFFWRTRMENILNLTREKMKEARDESFDQEFLDWLKNPTPLLPRGLTHDEETPR